MISYYCNIIEPTFPIVSCTSALGMAGRREPGCTWQGHTGYQSIGSSQHSHRIAPVKRERREGGREGERERNKRKREGHRERRQKVTCSLYIMHMYVQTNNYHNHVYQDTYTKFMQKNDGHLQSVEN